MLQHDFIKALEELNVPSNFESFLKTFLAEYHNQLHENRGFNRLGTGKALHDAAKALKFANWHQMKNTLDEASSISACTNTNEMVYVCDNCGFNALRDDMNDASDLTSRLTAGNIYTDKECPHCASLAYPNPTLPEPDNTGYEGESRFFDLNTQTQKDLLAWYNSAIDVTDAEEKELLDEMADLVENGQFEAWDCPHCKDERCYMATPDDWSSFQGTLNNDYASYPGNSERHTSEYIEKMCDHCRMTDV